MRLRNRKIYQCENMEGENQRIESESEGEPGQATPVGEIEEVNTESFRSEEEIQERGEKQNESEKNLNIHYSHFCWQAQVS